MTGISTTLHMKRVLKARREAYRIKEITLRQATDTLNCYLGMLKHCDSDALRESILDNFVLTHADKNIEEKEKGVDCYETVYC